jgi:hypothetical protein
MRNFSKASYHKDADNGWRPFSNDAIYRRENQDDDEGIEAPKEPEDEWAALRHAAHQQDLRFSVSHGIIRVGKARFPEDEAGVEDAWKYIAA